MKDFATPQYTTASQIKEARTKLGLTQNEGLADHYSGAALMSDTTMDYPLGINVCESLGKR